MEPIPDIEFLSYSKLRVAFFLADGRHGFRIDASSIEGLASAIANAQPLHLVPRFPSVVAPAGVVPPSGLNSHTGGFYFGWVLAIGAVAVLFTGHWVIAIIMGIWAYNLILDEGHTTRVGEHRRELPGAHAAAQKALEASKSRLEIAQRE